MKIKKRFTNVLINLELNRGCQSGPIDSKRRWPRGQIRWLWANGSVITACLICAILPSIHGFYILFLMKFLDFPMTFPEFSALRGIVPYTLPSKSTHTQIFKPYCETNGVPKKHFNGQSPNTQKV